jgi:hypothetical protein
MFFHHMRFRTSEADRLKFWLAYESAPECEQALTSHRARWLAETAGRP